MELIIIGFVIWYFYNKYFAQDKRKVINCPYCGKSLRLDSPGSYNCYSCSNMFHYKDDGRILRGEESINEGLILLAALYAQTAKADGVITPNEIQTIDEILKLDFELNPTQRTEFGNTFNRSREISHDPDQIIRELLACYGEHHDVLEFIISTLIRISDLDGGCQPEQERIIRSSVTTFYPRTKKSFDDFVHGSSDKSVQSSSLDQLYEVLECDSSVSDQTVKQAYRRLIQKYHPDKYRAKDLPEDMVEYGSRRFVEIQGAYEEIKKQRKFV